MAPIVQQPRGQPPRGYQQPYGQPPIMQQPMNMMPPPPPGMKGVPPGLEILGGLSHIFVKQQIELVEVIMDVETPNRYDVLAGNGQRIYLAQETTDPVCLQCGGSSRPFRVQIIDLFGRSVMTLVRTDGGCTGVMVVTAIDGSLLGQVSQQGCCTPVFDITDGAGQLIMRISGPPGADCCTGAADYPITTPSGQNLGIIRKTFSGFMQEWMTDADNFGVEFPPDLDIKWKALMFASVFLIDFIYYEKSPNHDRHHHRHHRHRGYY